MICKSSHNDSEQQAHLAALAGHGTTQVECLSSSSVRAWIVDLKNASILAAVPAPVSLGVVQLQLQIPARSKAATKRSSKNMRLGPLHTLLQDTQ